MNIEMETHGDSIVETPTNEEPKESGRKELQRAGITKKDEWLEQMRGNLSLMATVIATITFQMALNPPGGVRSVKDDGADNANDIACSDSSNVTLDLCPGEAVLAVVYKDEYFLFLVSNTICFVASLSICLLLVSGIPLHHRLPMWLLSIGMCVTLSMLAVSYITALQMTTPGTMYNTANKFLEKLIYGWVGLLAIIALWHTLRLIIWIVKLICKKIKGKSIRSYSSIVRQRVD
ncbi:uncharacterized protein LOC123885868 [Trifolium pratense]|uniref:uncharacterized protein LOC123885868 n=1 Tax=Trifolium pratense TaxID=57577 RepID=UPI0008424143|nr:uncharacterized protein LOC123885868 [Trifolium pratense]